MNDLQELNEKIKAIEKEIEDIKNLLQELRVLITNIPTQTIVINTEKKHLGYHPMG